MPADGPGIFETDMYRAQMKRFCTHPINFD